MWDMGFITEDDFRTHVANTINAYADNLVSCDIKRLNSNTIDPIKLIFDKSVYDLSWEETIKSEVLRQRDKSNNNSIGYFHQQIFRYIANCEVPQHGWDVIYRPEDSVDIFDGHYVSTLYVEMKNKHNTMNSASAGKTYTKMQDQLLQDDNCSCLLVEAIAKHSQNTQWSITLDKEKRGHRLIRRVSLDRFYELVTGDPNAFYKVCMMLPETIGYVLENVPGVKAPSDTAFEDLLHLTGGREDTVPKALYLLGFGSYIGFTAE
ncbi:MAG: Eco47II family restriction endonuclease [Coriobacteriia bacterium]|nr:Eco47II family restriction endonuclease [Coriobacteriia bacterium]